MIRLVMDSKIYVACPVGVVTGGPESLHNLVYHLCLLGHNAFIVYLPDCAKETPTAFKRYFVRRAACIVDSEKNLLIVPEIWTDRLENYRRIQKSIWWLSVDNHFIAGRVFNFDAHKNRGIIHFAQSTYVENFLLSRGSRCIYTLNSSINPTFRKPCRRVHRENMILYNPKKGFEFTKLLVEKYTDLNWVALEGMSREELISLMQKSKVYVDFGPFPGKDRLPRESVLNGCCIVIGLRGAARFYEDMPIPDSYKIEIEPFCPEKAIIPIRACLYAYDDCIRNFKLFRRIVLQEKTQFRRELLHAFGKGKRSMALVYYALPVLLFAVRIFNYFPSVMKRCIQKGIHKSIIDTVSKIA